MGTINYLTSDVITLVHDSSVYDRDFIRDECILNDSDVAPDGVTDSDIDFIIDNFVNDQMSELEKYVNFDAPTMEFFKLSAEYGYYEGAQLVIDDTTKYGFDCSQDKKQALKEANKIKNILHYIVSEYGFMACCPSWCPAYYDTKQTHARIDTAIKELKNRIRKQVITA